MIDVIVGVEDPVAWHAANMERNPSHYSSILKFLGPKGVAFVQDAIAARLWFNTLVPVSAGSPPVSQLYKYGVISLSALVDDLTHWRTLYLSGRMHKPIAVVHSPPEVLSAMSINLSTALSAALFSLPSTFSSAELFTRIAGLSYTGDFRMVIGENPRKIDNIVAGNLPGFARLYAPVMQSCGAMVTGSQSTRSTDELAYQLSRPDYRLTQDASGAGKAKLGEMLPLWLQAAMASRLRNTPGHAFGGTVAAGSTRSSRREGSPESVMWSRLSSGSLSPAVCAPLLLPSIATIVGHYSRTQSIKGIFTAGASKSVVYAGRKLAKMFK